MATSDPVESQTTRARSMPYRGIFYVATVWTLLLLFSIVATLVVLVAFLVQHGKNPTNVYVPFIILGFATSLLTLVISFYQRRKARCPLCRGTPLMNTGARAHAKSLSIGPFNHGFTAVLSIACTQKFSCMYCGTKYDLLKRSGQRSRQGRYPDDHMQHSH